VALAKARQSGSSIAAMKKLIVASAALLSTAAIAAPPTPDQRVSKIASEVSAVRMKATVTRLVGFGTRHTLS